MSSVIASRIKRETLYTRTILRACRADPGLSVLTGYYVVYHSILGPYCRSNIIYLLLNFYYFFSDRYKTLPNRFFDNKKHTTEYIGRLDIIISSKDKNNRILTIGSGSHFGNCLW